jgi:hypothetical protein
MGCGFGLCNTCVVPVVRPVGRPVDQKDARGYDNVRACIDGPVFNPARVLWDRWLDVPGPATSSSMPPVTAREDQVAP